MKKYFLFIIGIVAVIACAVSFASCETERDIVGTWEWRVPDDGNTYIYRYVFNSDNSGTMSGRWAKINTDSQNEDSFNFSYTYTFNKKTRKLVMKVSSFYGVETLTYKVNWVNNNTFYLRDAEYTGEYSYYNDEMGPFSRQ